MGILVTPDNIVNLMLSSCDNWNPVYVFARRVLMQQRLAERERSAVIPDCGSGGGKMANDKRNKEENIFSPNFSQLSSDKNCEIKIVMKITQNSIVRSRF